MRLTFIPLFIIGLAAAVPMPTSNLATNSTEGLDEIRCAKVSFETGPFQYLFQAGQDCTVIDWWSYEKHHPAPRPIKSVEFFGNCACSVYVWRQLTKDQDPMLNWCGGRAGEPYFVSRVKESFNGRMPVNSYRCHPL